MANPAWKNPAIRDFQSAIMGSASVERDIINNRCVSCRGNASSFKDEASKREFTISGLCQQCQDVAFAPDPDDY